MAGVQRHQKVEGAHSALVGHFVARQANNSGKQKAQLLGRARRGKFFESHARVGLLGEAVHEFCEEEFEILNLFGGKGLGAGFGHRAQAGVGKAHETSLLHVGVKFEEALLDQGELAEGLSESLGALSREVAHEEELELHHLGLHLLELVAHHLHFGGELLELELHVHVVELHVAEIVGEAVLHVVEIVREAIWHVHVI